MSREQNVGQDHNKKRVTSLKYIFEVFPLSWYFHFTHAHPYNVSKAAVFVFKYTRSQSNWYTYIPVSHVTLCKLLNRYLTSWYICIPVTSCCSVPEEGLRNCVCMWSENIKTMEKVQRVCFSGVKCSIVKKSYCTIKKRGNKCLELWNSPNTWEQT